MLKTFKNLLFGMPLESEKKKRETNVCDVRDLKIVAGYNNDTRRMK